MSIKGKAISFLRWFFGFKPKQLIRKSDRDRQYSITVIVPAYNEEKSIADTVRSIQLQTYPVTEIIVVDDCSSDRTSEIAISLGVSVVRTHENQGSKAKAQNYVLNQVHTDLFLTVDGDTVLAPDAIEQTIPFFVDEKSAMVCGMVIPQRIRTLWERGRFIEYLYGLTIIKPAQNHNRMILVSSGCFSVFRTEVVKELGGFESRTMAEDMDLTWNATAEGYHVYFTPQAISYPVDPPSLRVYWQQIQRWNRALLQNISVRNGWIKSWRLAFLIYYYLIWALLSPLLVPYLFWLMSDDIWLAIAIALAAQALLVWLPAYIQVVYMWYKGRSFGFPGNNHSLPRLLYETLISCLCFLVTQYVNFIAFMVAVYREWVLRERLSVWNKGH